MMEQLAERRMKREQQAQYASHQTNQPYNGGHDHPPGLEEDDEYDDDEEYDDEEEEYEEEEDEMASNMCCRLAPGLTLTGCAYRRAKNGRRSSHVSIIRCSTI